MAASALLLGASIASLNLCADEYLLLLAHPHEIASVTMLSQDSLESPLWRAARRHRANSGSIESVLTLRPHVVLTMGGGGRATSLIARRIGIRSVDLTPTTNIDDVARNLRSVAAALGEPQRAGPWIARLDRLRRSTPRGTQDAVWLSGGGQSFAAGSAGTRWLRLAGLQHRRLRADRVTLESLLIDPPEILVRSDYRAGQISRGRWWLDHPIVRRLNARRVATDGRRWTCLGPLMIPEIQRLRKAVG